MLLNMRHTISLCFLFAFLLTNVCKICYCEELRTEDLYKKVLPSIVTLMVKTKDGTAVGTAFLAIQDGVAITAWHVVDNAQIVKAEFSTGEEFEVLGIIDKDERRDICLIRIKVAGRPLLELANDDPDIGSKACIVGAPRGLDFSISEGIINQIRTYRGVKYFQFSCAASPGNSGGPLLNSAGKVLGVVSWQVVNGQNLNFAIPASYALGLNASLPTKPWKQARGYVPSVTGPNLLPDELDKSLADAYALTYDWETAYYVLNRSLSQWLQQKKQRNTPSVPPEVYTFLDEATKLKQRLGTPNSTECRENIRIELLEQLNIVEEVSKHYISAITMVQKTHEWTGEVKQHLAEIIELHANWVPLSNYDIRLCGKSKAFTDALPIQLRYTTGILDDRVKLYLGVLAYSRSSLSFVEVDKKGIAYSLGLRSGDTVLAVGRQNLNYLQEFKVLLFENLGKRLEIHILRDGKKKTLTVKLPVSFEEYAL